MEDIKYHNQTENSFPQPQPHSYPNPPYSSSSLNMMAHTDTSLILTPASNLIFNQYLALNIPNYILVYIVGGGKNKILVSIRSLYTIIC